MIEARHTRWAEWIFYPYLHWLIRRSFRRIAVLGPVPECSTDTNLFLLPNHSTWWDGFFVLLLNERIFKRKPYIMMLERQLRKYSFFRRICAYSIDPEKPKKIIESIHYTSTQLDESPGSRLVCYFPQGELLPWNARPLGYKKGLERVCDSITTPVTILPLAMRCEFQQDQKPSCYCLFGEPRHYSPGDHIASEQLESDETKLLEELLDRIASGETGEDIMAGSVSVNDRLDKMRGKYQQ
ncbi:MAG: hypothetical protein CL946_11210 [Ectothiorhodospiraceae bacterium]|nr:hypothetical protein [Ectothiorhodospiraceae bacterium]